MFSLNSVRVAPGARSALAVACGVALSAFHVGAQAEEAVAPVVVTASRMVSPVQTAPVAASVITSEQMARAGVADANEAIRKLGGVAARSDLNNGRENVLDLRGYGETAGQNLVVLLDGMRISENELASARLSAIPLAQIERIGALAPLATTHVMPDCGHSPHRDRPDELTRAIRDFVSQAHSPRR